MGGLFSRFAGVDATEPTLSRSLDALLLRKLPTLVPHVEKVTLARDGAVSVEVTEDTDAIDAKLRGRSFFSPEDGITEGLIDDGCCGDVASGDVALAEGVVALLANGLVKAGNPRPLLEACL